MVAFGGWEMPVEYTSITEEHMAVRTRAGLFDVSHMGEIEIAGSAALAALQHISCNDAARLQVGQAQYSALTTPEGTFIDDILVYRLAQRHFLLVVNASNLDKDYAWMRTHRQSLGDVAAVNTSARYALLALQGPAAARILQPLTGVDLGSIKYYWFASGEVANVRVTISRTGYTGEDGFELFAPPHAADRLWTTLLQSGAGAGLLPAGLGARDTLRLEAAMRLYGNDMDETTTVLEAGLNWIVGWNKADFIGRDALLQQERTGIARTLVGFEMIDRGIARHGYAVSRAGQPIGHVTSGTRTPFLKKAIGMASVPSDSAHPGTEFEIDLRGRPGRARAVPMPFYKRAR
jgi:aminomethyltransferase